MADLEAGVVGIAFAIHRVLRYWLTVKLPATRAAFQIVVCLWVWLIVCTIALWAFGAVFHAGIVSPSANIVHHFILLYFLDILSLDGIILA